MAIQYWGRWRPDGTGVGNGFAQTIDGVMPIMAGIGRRGVPLVGYGPYPQLVTPSGAGALSGAPRGNISLVKSDGSNAVFYGTASTIEQLSSSYTFTVVDSGRTCTSGDDWSFLKFGNFLLATNTTDGLRAYNVETPAGFNTISGAPSNVRSLFSCNNVVFALDCGGNNRRMQSSGLGDHTAWSSLGADGKTFEDGGALLKGVDLKNGQAVIFQSNAMRGIDFSSAPGGALYRTFKIADARGSVGAKSIIGFDGIVFYLATDGFYRYDLSNGNQPIGANEVDSWFLARCATSDLANVEASIDPKNKIVAWRYKGPNAVSTSVYGDMLCYHWGLNVWFTWTVNTSSLARIATPGYTLEDMDAFGTLDGMSQIPLDDRFWQGGQPVFAALDANYKFATFSGTPMAATLRGGEMPNPVTGIINAVTPISDASTSTLKIGTRDRLTDSVTYSTGLTRERNGQVSTRALGANIQFEEDIPAGATWTFSHGVDFVSEAPGGPR